MWVGNSLGMDGLLKFCLLDLLVGKDLLPLLYLPIKVITKFRVTNMTVYKCIIYEIKKHSLVTAILAFKIESLRSCFLICYIYITHTIAVKVDDVKTRNMCFCCWSLCSSHYIIYPTHTINTCCQKENRLVVIPFAANILRIMEITFTSGNFVILFQFWHLLSIWPYCSYGVNFILKMFINQC